MSRIVDIALWDPAAGELTDTQTSVQDAEDKDLFRNDSSYGSINSILQNGSIKKIRAKKTLNAFSLACIGYFLTCGGPFGVESSVQSAGPLYALIGLIAFPFLWSLPQGLLGAELSLMYPENGGNIVWVQKAFGDFIGWVNAYNNTAYLICSLAAFVVLLTNYIDSSMPWWLASVIRTGFVMIVIIVNIVGLSLISKLSLLFLVMIMAPFVCLALDVLITHRFEGNDILDRPSVKDIDYGLYISTLVYAYGGFDSLGSFAGEVKGGRSTFLWGMLGILPVNILNYLVPLIFGYFLIPDYNSWTDGTYTDTGKKVGLWLQIMIIIASVLSNFGMVNSVAMVARNMWAMAKGEGTSQKLPSFLYTWSWQRRPGGSLRPVAAILVTSLIPLFMGLVLPWGTVLEVIFIFRIVNLLLEYAALIALRIKAPNAHRPFVIPGGFFVVCALPIPSVFFCGVMLYAGKWYVLVTGAGFNVIVILAYVIVKYVKHFQTYTLVKQNNDN